MMLIGFFVQFRLFFKKWKKLLYNFGMVDCFKKDLNELQYFGGKGRTFHVDPDKFCWF